MTTRLVSVPLLLLAALLATPTTRAQSPEALRFWPQWRGPLATGEAPKADPPTEWSESKNIRWKLAIPGKGNATPIIWGGRVYVLTAVPTETADASAVGDAKPADQGSAPGASPSGGPRDTQLIADPQAQEDKPQAQTGGSNPNQERPERGERPRRPEGQDRPPRPDGPGGDRPGRRERGPRKAAAPQKFVVMAVDRKSGKIVWEKAVKEEKPHEAGHPDASYASGSPVTDGKHLWASFGSRGLFCLDLDGNVKWEKNLGQMKTRNEFGEGISPAVHGDTLVINWDHEGEDFIVGLNALTGEQLWKAERDEPTTWATPLIVEVDGKPQVITSGTNRVRSYDLKTGKLVWECAGLTQNVIPTPVCADGVVYAISGFRGAALKAIRLAGATGDISDSKAIVWTYEQNTPYVPSPLLAGGALYFLDNNRGVLTCLDAKTGKVNFGPQRLDEVTSVYASPVLAAGRIYIAGRDGKTAVLKAGPAFEVLATNALDEGFDASPAVVDGELYLRGSRHLYCIASK